MNKRLRAAMSELIKQNPAACSVKTVRFSYFRCYPVRHFPAASWATLDAAGQFISCRFFLTFERESGFSSVQELSDAITELLTLRAASPASFKFRHIIFDDVKELERLLVVLERMNACLSGDLTQLMDGDSHVFSITTGWSLKTRKKNLTFPE